MSYSSKKDYLNHFQEKYQSFVEKNLLPEKNEGKVLIKYCIIVENIIEKSIHSIPSDKYYIWTRDHVKKYIKNKTAFIWILRVYKLKKPYWAEANRGIQYANLKKNVSIDAMEPILTDNVFLNIIHDI